jgi:hypothetical protein
MLSALLLLHGFLIFFAIRRGWRLAPFVVMALPQLAAQVVHVAPAISLAGWYVPISTLVMLVGLLATTGLVYTAVVDPEPA